MNDAKVDADVRDIEEVEGVVQSVEGRDVPNHCHETMVHKTVAVAVSRTMMVCA